MAVTFQLSHAVIGAVSLDGYVSPGGFGYAIGDDLIWTTLEMVDRRADKLSRNEFSFFERYREQARLYVADSTRKDPVYFLWTNDGETAKRSIVHDITFEIIPEGKFTALQGHNAIRYRLAIQHSPIWEATSAQTQHDETAISTLGGNFDYAPGGYSSIPARINVMTLTATTSTYTSLYSKVWIGIRDFRHGITSFNPVWEVEGAERSTDTTTASASAASGDGYLVTDFSSTAGMSWRGWMTLSNVVTTTASSEEASFIGKYLALGRVKLSAATVECAFDLRYGWLDLNQSLTTETSAGITFISGVENSNLTEWNLVPLGVIEIPATGDRDGWASGTTGRIRSFGLKWYIERLSDAGSFNLDCFVMIPTDHMCILDPTLIGTTGISTYTNSILTGEDDVSYALSVLNTGGINIGYSFDNWNYPGNGTNTAGLVVVAAQAATAHEIGSQLDISMQITPRVLSYFYAS